MSMMATEILAELLTASTTSSGWLLASILVLLTLYYWPIWNRSRYPPGPLPLPFIGNSLDLLSSHYMKKYAEKQAEYGELVTLYNGSRPTIVLNSKEAIYEAFVKNADFTSSRPDLPTKVLPFQGLGLISAHEGNWQILRRQLLMIFKEHGVGKLAMEDQIKDEIAYFTKELTSLQGQPVNLDNLLKQSVSNVITRIVFGQRFEYSKEQVDNLQIEPYIKKLRPIMFLPVLRLLPGDPFGYYAAKKKYEDTALTFAKQQIAEHRRTLDVNSPRDFIDTFLIEMTNKTHPIFQDESTLISEVMQLYVAGTDTTSVHLNWSLAYMLHYPEIQEKIHQEVIQHIGERAPLYADRNLMPYTMSFITEILRLGNAFTSIPHITSSDITVRGQTIPKGTVLRANIWGACHDPVLYSDPNTFKPDRFINKDGEYEKPDARSFVPFSIGRRICPGEPLARMEFFLFLVTIVQKFKISNGMNSLPCLDPDWLVILTPKPFKLILTPR